MLEQTTITKQNYGHKYTPSNRNANCCKRFRSAISYFTNTLVHIKVIKYRKTSYNFISVTTVMFSSKHYNVLKKRKCTGFKKKKETGLSLTEVPTW